MRKPLLIITILFILVQLPIFGQQKVFLAKGDFDGNGKDDILFHYVINNQIVVWFNSGYDFEGYGSGYDFEGYGSGRNWCSYGGADDQFLDTGDFNGDAKDDLLYWDKKTNQVVVWFNSGHDFRGKGSGKNWCSYGGADDQFISAGDFNGDNLDDLLYWDKETNQVVVWFNSGHDFRGEGSGKNWCSYGGANDYLLDAGDFNGDILDDLLYWNKETNQVVVWFNSGHDFRGEGSGKNWCSYGGADDQILAAGDFNGDNLDDLLYLKKPNCNFIIWFNRGYDFRGPGSGRIWRAPSVKANDEEIIDFSDETIKRKIHLAKNKNESATSYENDVLEPERKELIKECSIIIFASAVGITVACLTGGTAAPIIGTIIGNLMGYTGAAATSAGLALLGGGSLVAGGFGMAGGTIVVFTAINYVVKIATYLILEEFARVNCPDNEYVAEAKNSIAYVLEHPEESQKYYNHALRKLIQSTMNDQDIIRSYYLISDILIKKEQYAKAEFILREINSNFKGSSYSRVMLADLLMQQNRLDTVKDLLYEARKTDPKYPEIYVKLSNYYINQNDLPAAKSALLEGITVNDEAANLVYLLGMLYVKENLLETAHKYFVKAYDMEDKNSAYILALAGNCKALKKYEDAKDYFEEYYDVVEENTPWEILYEIADLNAQANDYEEAKKWIQKASLKVDQDIDKYSKEDYLKIKHELAKKARKY